MRIDAVNNNEKGNTPNFKKLIIDKSATKLLNTLSEQDKVELQNIKNRMSNTKFWNMKIFCTNNNPQNMSFEFIEKNNSRVISDSIFPYNKNGKNISIYSIVYSIKNCPKNIIEQLKFKSKKRADEIYNNYKENMQSLMNRNYNIPLIELIKNKEMQVMMLEESYANNKLSTKKKPKVINTKFKMKDYLGKPTSHKLKQ